jgi:peptide/nickel transport system substrate-binding protein
MWTGAKPFQLATGKLAVATLNLLGYRASLKVVVGQNYFGTVADSRTRAQAGFVAWSADYPAASNFLMLLTCGTFHAANQASLNYSELCNHRLDQAFSRALAEQTTDAPEASNARWNAVDRIATSTAAWVPLVNTREVVVTSRRVRNLQVNPEWGVLMDELWVK